MNFQLLGVQQIPSFDPCYFPMDKPERVMLAGREGKCPTAPGQRRTETGSRPSRWRKGALVSLPLLQGHRSHPGGHHAHDLITW